MVGQLNPVGYGTYVMDGDGSGDPLAEKHQERLAARALASPAGQAVDAYFGRVNGVDHSNGGTVMYNGSHLQKVCLVMMAHFRDRDLEIIKKIKW